ncbi:Crp/Fnr family transcriptional regulator [Marinomonas sp. 15G1-11]|uniref:Crp/Fnr family transcriptional regulator n=1 Tax=Marinomonas phaeophyticola TaxID=3004091 RepID=A0ABT4JT81_9GAMM|nr:Crp/Fnr family transcriptional regulator [Marinomonas sp. 15G1-11]MCZ2721456.1 Crp/Fnr family transcriptional regulator [Marinomonas sp. 15G1-11]
MDKEQLQLSFQNYFDNMGDGVQWDRLSTPMEIHSVLKGNYLFQQGDKVDRFFFLHTGLVRYVSVSKEGKEYTQTFAKGPRIVGSTRAMVSQTPVLFSIQALEDSIVLSYSWADFFQQMRQDKAFLECYCHFLEHIFIIKEEKESAFAKDSAEKRYLDFCTDYPELKDKLPQQQIASYLSITPVALSRIRQRLKRG